MKAFFYRLSYFALLVLSILFIFDLGLSYILKSNSTLNYLSDEYTVWNDILEQQIDADIVVYGSSRAFVQFDTPKMSEALGCRAYNMGINGHNFILQLFRHRQFLANNQKPQLIIYSVDHISQVKAKRNFQELQLAPYALFNKAIFDLYKEASEAAYLKTYFPMYRYRGEFDAIKRTLKIISGKTHKEDNRTLGFKGMKRHWNDELNNSFLERETINIELDTSLQSSFETFIASCQANKIKLLFVAAPIHPNGFKIMENYSLVSAYFNNLSRKYDVPFFNYAQHPIIQDTSFFYNSMHLNEKGAKAFTEELIADLYSGGLIDGFDCN